MLTGTLGPQTRQVFAKGQQRAQHVRTSPSDVECRELRAGRDPAGPLATPAASLRSGALCQHAAPPWLPGQLRGRPAPAAKAGHPWRPSDWIWMVRRASGHRAPSGPPPPRRGAQPPLSDVTRSLQLACSPVGGTFPFLYSFRL